MYSRRKVIGLFSVILVLLSLVTVALAADVTDDSKQVAATQSDVEWATYTDPRFDFTIDYPANWIINPRNDSQNVIATLSFSEEIAGGEDHADPHGSPVEVVIGLYLVAWPDQESVTNSSLKEWTDIYNELSTAPEAKERTPRESRYFQVDRHQAIYEEGKGAFSKIRYVNIPRGNIVWFIWSNGEVTVHSPLV